MMLLVDGFEPLSGNMGVNLGRGQIGVSQQLLDYFQIGTAIQHVSGEGVAHHVRVNPFAYARFMRKSIKYFLCSAYC